MTKSASTNKKPRKQHTPEFRKEALRPNKHIALPLSSSAYMNHSLMPGTTSDIF